ncbi:hypothetical protein GGP41_004393 [Bipolaris sorokiniana]|uniref:Uncharacterized protein n=1 Tax=Cochliobolus sativus TaxID=45130 RepID=A0A8H5ZLX1_COCSA|nr:hypothetical protein GGP41_004393 [Bipolaris sorokiniana]
MQKGEFLLYVRAFNLKFNKASFRQDNDAIKINYFKNSLNRKLLRLYKPMPNLEPSNAPPRPPTLKDAKGVREELQEMKALFFRTAQGQATPNAQTSNLTPSIESQQPSS